MIDPSTMRNHSILLVCTKFGTSDDDRYLTNELADALASKGKLVQVLALQWSAPPGAPPQAFRQSNGVEVLILCPRQVNHLGKLVALGTKWIGSSLAAVTEIRGHLADSDFDLLIAFSPAVTCAFPILWAMRRFRCSSYIYVTDFFPLHHRSIGLLSQGLIFEIARRAETALLRRFDVIGCMSQLGVAYLRQHYELRREQRTKILRLWGPVGLAPEIDRSAERQTYDLPSDRQSPFSADRSVRAEASRKSSPPRASPEASAQTYSFS